MAEKNYLATLSENILKQRKEKGLTQEILADKLNISYQAVSKWETGQSSPDITMLPLLAEIFDVSVDELFGLCAGKTAVSLPWKDDGIVRGVVYKGTTLLGSNDNLSQFTFSFDFHDDVLGVESGCNINCGDIAGNAKAGVSINCGDITGDAKAGVSIDCGDITGNASAGIHLNCGDVGGYANGGA